MQLDGEQGVFRLSDWEKAFLERPDLDRPNEIYPVTSSGELLKRARKCMNYNFGHIATAAFFDALGTLGLEPIEEVFYVFGVAQKAQSAFETYSAEGIQHVEQYLAEAGS